MKKTLLLSLLLALGMSYSLKAQFHLGFSGQLGVPIEEFKENTDALGFGFRANLYVPFAPTVPVFFGLDFGYMVYGTNTQNINENINVTAGNVVLSSIPINLRVTTNNNLINSYAVLRIKAPLSIVQPYIDGLVGFNYLYTRTKIYDETQNRILTSSNQNQQNNVINAQTQINSLVFSYGGGGGMMLRLGSNVKLDIRGIYLFGQEAQYYDASQTRNWEIQFTGTNFNPNDIDPDEINVSSPEGTPKKSRTDLFSINLGLVVDF